MCTNFVAPVANHDTYMQRDSIHTQGSPAAMGSMRCLTLTDTCVHGWQTAAVQTQTARVQQLQSQAATGKVSVKRVEKEQNVLFKMTVSYSHTIGVVTLHKLPWFITPAWLTFACAECAKFTCD